MENPSFNPEGEERVKGGIKPKGETSFLDDIQVLKAGEVDRPAELQSTHWKTDLESLRKLKEKKEKN